MPVVYIYGAIWSIHGSRSVRGTALLLTSDRKKPTFCRNSTARGFSSGDAFKRHPSWYARPPDSQDAHAAADARLGHQPTDRTVHSRHSRGEPGLAVSRPAAIGREGMDRERMACDGKQSEGA